MLDSVLSFTVVFFCCPHPVLKVRGNSLRAADKTDVLPDNVIFEILSANPDELKKEELLKYLEDKENPLPSYMVDILRQVAKGVTYKTVLEQQMARYNQAKTRAAYDMIRSNLNDTVADFNELRNWLDNVGGIRADEQIIDSYLKEGNTTDALALANMLPQLYNYKGETLTEHNYYLEMLNLSILLKQEGRTFLDLDTAEIDNLMIIAENSKGTAGAEAKGILESNYGHHFCDCLNIEGAEGLKSSGTINTGAFTEMFGADVEVRPNPASDWTTFNFRLPGKETKGTIEISDVSGKLIESFVISGNQGQKIWDTRKINEGVYFYTFTVNGISKSGKIVISK